MGTDGFRVGIGFRVLGLGLRSFTCETRGGTGDTEHMSFYVKVSFRD